MIRRVTSVIAIVILSLNLNLHGDIYASKSLSLWQLYHYKYTSLLRQSPLCYEPYKAYVLVDQYVVIKNQNNRNVISVTADIPKLLKSDTDYNKSHAKRYKGSTKAKVKKIFRYCSRTKYKAHVKTAHEVFQTRTGDCAGISSAFYVLCKVNRIPVRYVIGWTKSNCHAWNRVRIKGQWYWIDCTKGLWLSRKQFKGRTVLEYW